MRERDKNIFYGLAPINEDSATELLCNLCRFDTCKELIFTELHIDDNQRFSFDEMNTQYTIPQKTKKPDIVIKNAEMKIFIESKVTKHTTLAKSQLNDYPEYLKNLEKAKNKKIMLIFLIPKGYKHCEKIETAKKKYPFISIVYWDDLLESMKLKNKQLKSEILSESITFFEKVLNSIPEIIFSQEEKKIMTDINHLAAESAAIGKTLDLFCNIIESLKNNLQLKFKSGEPYKEVSDIELHCSFHDEKCFLGYDFTLLEDKLTEKYVLSLALHKDIVSKDKLKKIDKESYYFDDKVWYYFNIDKNWLENENKEQELLHFCEKVIKDVVKNIH